MVHPKNCWHGDCYSLCEARNCVATTNQRKEIVMLSWAVTFLIVAIIAGLLGFSGIAGAATNIAWILFVVGLILAIIFAIRGKKPL